MKRRLIPGRESVLAHTASSDRPQTFMFLTHDIRDDERRHTLHVIASAVNAFEAAAEMAGVDAVQLAAAAEANPGRFMAVLRAEFPHAFDRAGKEVR